MKAVAFYVTALVVVVCGATVSLHAQEAASASAGTGAVVAAGDKDRVFTNFTREAVTVGHGILRVELRGFRSEDEDDPDVDVLGFPLGEVERNSNNRRVVRTNGGVVDLLTSFGIGKNAEVGIDFPGVFEKFRFEDGSTENSTAFGDMLMYLKFALPMAENCRLGGGVELTPPTGSERHFTGTGELGINPFVSTRYQYKRLGVGGHVGWNIYTGSVDDIFNYSAHMLVRAAHSFTLRLEFSGRHQHAFGENLDDVVVLPGIDFHIGDYLSIRPTGMSNITNAAHDWGIGLGIAGQLPLL